MKMKRNQYKKLGNLLTYVVVVVEAMVIIGMFIFGSSGSNSSIQETDIIWVDFNVSGNIRVEVQDTNCGEVPDEAWEEARRVLGEFGNYASLDLSVRGKGRYTEVIVP